MRATRLAALPMLLAAILLGCCSCAGRAAPFADSGLSSGTGSSAGTSLAAGSGLSPTSSGPSGTSGQAPGTSPEPVVSGAAGTTPAANATLALPSRKMAAARPLAGKIIGIDPRHEGGNLNGPTFMSQQICGD